MKNGTNLGYLKSLNNQLRHDGCLVEAEAIEIAIQEILAWRADDIERNNRRHRTDGISSLF